MHEIMLDATMRQRHASERGGGPHVIKRLDPARTAHLIVDMQNGFMEIGAPVEVPMARQTVPAVNRISRALRDAGGTNVFLQFTTPRDLASWSVFYERSTPEFARVHQAAFTPGAHFWQLWPDLDVDLARDVRIEKARFGAFIPGTCDLDAFLRERGIDTLIITGTLTNCCCESTARDAMQLNYKVIFATDANAALSDAEHNATLHNMSFVFADVMSTAEIEGLLQTAKVEA
ncbi:MAG: cysteine hydrolase [Sphingobium sp.]|nr:cysteine hydrolase [Sphingobium sp.]